MLKKLLLFLLILISLVGFWSFQKSSQGTWTKVRSSEDVKDAFMNSGLEEVLIQLGETPPIHYIAELDADSVRMGEELIRYGQLLDGSSKRISKFFLCTDCHNTVLETDNPADESPETVLAYSKKKDIPFLPGSTFYSMYNKRHWYNGDYDKKYGALVAPTRDTLYNAIQLCATQCSQGREMEFWEVRSVMHYYKSIQLKISDLVFAKDELTQLWQYVNGDKEKALNLIHAKYNEYNDAHFGSTETPVIEGYSPSFENGEFIYKNGCMHCHSPQKDITNFDLSIDDLSFDFLTAKKDKHNHFSVTYITRKGTYAVSGRKQYMPQYSYENMSDQQMLDLLFYIETMAKK